MKLTIEHGRFYAFHLTPPVIRKACKMNPGASIHRLVNLHAGLKDAEIGVNALHLLDMRRKNGDSPEIALRESEWDKQNIPKRFFAFRRWRRNLLKSRRSA